MVVARVDRTRVGAGDLGFRLGPRINAAGRLGHPGDALELLLTDDEEPGRELAEQARGAEPPPPAGRDARSWTSAVAQVEARRREWRARRAYVLASSEWHEGVIGIVASRLVERYGRPVVLIADRRRRGEGLGPQHPRATTCTPA